MNGKWTLFPGDHDQWTVVIEHYDGLVAVTVGDVTTELTPAEARHMAGAIMYAAGVDEMDDGHQTPRPCRNCGGRPIGCLECVTAGRKP